MIFEIDPFGHSINSNYANFKLRISSVIEIGEGYSNMLSTDRFGALRKIRTILQYFDIIDDRTLDGIGNVYRRLINVKCLRLDLKYKTEPVQESH